MVARDGKGGHIATIGLRPIALGAAPTSQCACIGAEKDHRKDGALAWPPIMVSTCLPWNSVMPIERP